MFIAVYTHQCKQYCDEQFFANLLQLAGNNPVHIVDNTPGTIYIDRLWKLTTGHQNVYIQHIDVDPLPDRTRFLRNVADGANACRDAFLTTNEQHFLIIESDVIPPVDVVQQLENSIQQLPENWAALGALYYKGFHSYDLTGIHQCGHTLSGCTVYSRKFIELFPFEWRTENLDAFPDAYAGVNAGSVGMGHYNNHDIQCEHLK